MASLIECYVFKNDCFFFVRGLEWNLCRAAGGRRRKTQAVKISIPISNPLKSHKCDYRCHRVGHAADNLCSARSAKKITAGAGCTAERINRWSVGSRHNRLTQSLPMYQFIFHLYSIYTFPLMVFEQQPHIRAVRQTACTLPRRNMIFELLHSWCFCIWRICLLFAPFLSCNHKSLIAVN